MVRRITLPLFFLFIINLAQSQEMKVITAFDPLVDHTWEITGQWGNGLNFKQEMTINREASGAIITVNTNGYLNENQTEWGPRSHGIRQIDAATGKMIFYEFDAFGQMIQGEVQTKGKDFYYIYEYEDLTLADHWGFVDQNNYIYRIGTYTEGALGEVYLEGKVTRK